MSHYTFNAFKFSLNPKPPEETKVSLQFNAVTLLNYGFNMPCQIATSTAFVEKNENPEPLRTAIVIAHFDTGASKTSIDINLAKHLGLIATGMSPQRTAGGVRIYPTYAIDLAFLNTNLSPYPNLQIGSCDLGIDLATYEQNPLSLKNMGLLIGRDVMSRWNVFWNGPTSCVYISD
jgi:hypothetical protein